MMKKTALIALLLVFAMLFSLFAGCGKKEPADTETKASQEVSDTDAGKTTAADDKSDETEDLPEDESPYNTLKTYHTGSVESAYDPYDSTSTCPIVFEDGVYIAQKYDSDADILYRAICGNDLSPGKWYSELDSAWYGYFQFATDETGVSVDDPASFNRYGLIDSTGETILPEEYADISMLSSRFAITQKVTGKSSNEYAPFSYGVAKDENSLIEYDGFSAEQKIFDLETKTFLPIELPSDHSGDIRAYGNFISWYPTDKYDKRTAADYKGNPLPDGAELFVNGTYKIENGDKGTVYDENGEVFTYDASKYTVYCELQNNIEVDPTESVFWGVLKEKNEQGHLRYYPLDPDAPDEQLIVFDSDAEDIENLYIDYDVYGNCVRIKDKLYTYDEAADKIKEIATVTGDISRDNSFERGFIVTDNGTSVLYDMDGKEIASKNGFVSRSDEFCLEDENYGVYIISTGEIKAGKMYTETVAPWVYVAENADGTLALIDSYTGETLIDGYNYYDTIGDGGNSMPNVYAVIAMKEGTNQVDVYEIFN